MPPICCPLHYLFAPVIEDSRGNKYCSFCQMLLAYGVDSRVNANSFVDASRIARNPGYSLSDMNRERSYVSHALAQLHPGTSIRVQPIPGMLSQQEGPLRPNQLGVRISSPGSVSIDSSGDLATQLGQLPSYPSQGNAQMQQQQQQQQQSSQQQAHQQPGMPGLMHGNMNSMSAAGQSGASQQSQPCGPGQPTKDRRCIWQGMIEFQEKPPSQALQQTERVTNLLPCTFSSVMSNGEPEVNAEKWPGRLVLQLIPKKLLDSHLFTVLKTAAKHILIHLNQESEALQKLCKAMSTGWVGCIQFPTPCDVRIMIILYMPEKRIYMGFIPNDQDAFFNKIRQMYESLRKQQRMQQISENSIATSVGMDMPSSTSANQGMIMSQRHLEENLHGPSVVEEIIGEAIEQQEHHNLDNKICFLCGMWFYSAEICQKHQHHVHMCWVDKRDLLYSQEEFEEVEQSDSEIGQAIQEIQSNNGLEIALGNSSSIMSSLEHLQMNVKTNRAGTAVSGDQHGSDFVSDNLNAEIAQKAAEDHGLEALDFMNTQGIIKSIEDGMKKETEMSKEYKRLWEVNLCIDDDELWAIGFPQKVGHFCHICDAVIKSYRLYYKHMHNLHQLEKRFQCVITACRRTFTNTFMFQKHAQSHNQKSGFVCSMCDNVFGDDDDLQDHLLNSDHANKYMQLQEKYSRTEPRNYRCKICHSWFGLFAAFVKHMETESHSYQCHECGLLFVQPGPRHIHTQNFHPEVANIGDENCVDEKEKEKEEHRNCCSSSIDAMCPSTKDEFDYFRNRLTKKIMKYEKSPYFSPFLEKLCQDLCNNFDYAQIKKISVILQELAREKLKVENMGSCGKVLNDCQLINSMGQKMGIDKKTIETATSLFKTVTESKKLIGRSHASIASACIYLACRQQCLPINYKDVQDVSTSKERNIHKCIAMIMESFDFQVDSIDPCDFIPRLCAELNLPMEIQNSAIVIANKAVDLDIAPCRRPSSVAAAAVYLASQASSLPKCVEEVADTADIAVATVKSTYRQILSYKGVFPEVHRLISSSLGEKVKDK